VQVKQVPLSSLPRYQYTKLPTVRTCRLVRLRKKLHRATKAVQVELVEADVDNPPGYNALSYAVNLSSLVLLS
jgi:hypothetical protein